MPFSVGLHELLVVSAVLAPTLVLFARGDDRYRSLVPLVACAGLAALLTPADLASMALFLAALLAAFALGVWYRTSPEPSTGG